VDEQAFRYNTRKDAEGNVISDYERFKTALSQIVGRRLTYAQLTGKEAEATSRKLSKLEGRRQGRGKRGAV
jgi:hypothetical protein